MGLRLGADRMVAYKCPCCGNIGDKPLLFTFAKQKIFAYIWDNPGCTSLEIQRDVIRSHGALQTTTNTIRYIESILERTTSFRLIRTKKHPGRRGASIHHYKIIHKPPVGVTGATTEGPTHGTV